MDSFLQGRGKYEWADGRVYEGEWSKDEMNGSGVYTWPDGKRFVGEFINGKKQGWGVIEEKEGTYAGQWMNSLKHGPGKYTYPNGRIVQGIWVEGVLRKTVEDIPAPNSVKKPLPIIEERPKPAEEIKQPAEETKKLAGKLVESQLKGKVSIIPDKKEEEKQPTQQDSAGKGKEVSGEELIRRLKESAKYDDSSDDYEDDDEEKGGMEQQKNAEPPTDSRLSHPPPTPSSFSLSEGSRISLLQSFDFPASFPLTSYATPTAIRTRQALGPFSYPSILTDGKAFIEAGKLGKGVLYRGEVDGMGERSGRGVSLQDGEIWEGMWETGKLGGLGRRIAADGGVHVGFWQDGQPHGFGVFTSASSIYSGEWIHGQRQGLGFERTAEHTYQGQFQNGSKHGHGRLELPKEGVYEGMMKMNRRDGYGTMVTMEGIRYAGEWHEDRMEGKGVRMKGDSPAFTLNTGSFPSLPKPDLQQHPPTSPPSALRSRQPATSAKQLPRKGSPFAYSSDSPESDPDAPISAAPLKVDGFRGLLGVRKR